MRSTFHARTEQPVFHHPRIQERPDEFQQPLVIDTLGDLSHQSVVIDSIEKLLQVEVNHPAIACSNIPLCLCYSLMSRSPRSKTVAVIGKLRVPPLLQNLHDRLLDESIQYRRDGGSGSLPSTSTALRKTWARSICDIISATCCRRGSLRPALSRWRISALRFLYKRTLKRRDPAYHDLIFPKVPHRLPTVLSREEVVRLIDAAPNRLYRILIVLLYATGARRAEAARIKVEDIDSQRMVIHIRQGKGAKDRDVPLSPKLLEELRSWWR